MAKKKNNVFAKEAKVEDKKSYVAPTETLFGKIVIWFLVILMVSTIIIGFIIAAINYF